MSDKATIAAGKVAWRNIRKTSTFDAWLTIGVALLVGRRVCMEKAGTTRPYGSRYIRAFSAWMTEHGFHEIVKPSRTAAMQCAENAGAIRMWLATASTKACHPVEVWSAYREHRAKQAGRNTANHPRMRIDTETAATARDDVRLAVSDLVRRKCYDIPTGAIEEIAEAAFVATANALDIAVRVTTPKVPVAKVAA
jgi:hypothetical protein